MWRKCGYARLVGETATGNNRIGRRSEDLDVRQRTHERKAVYLLQWTGNDAQAGTCLAALAARFARSGERGAREQQHGAFSHCRGCAPVASGRVSSTPRRGSGCPRSLFIETEGVDLKPEYCQAAE
jgi:hypothetical protein